ncbi:hypothetical protein J8I82_36620 [Cupriavidus sp. LEh25]|nr:hypothetical protein [Cupriavidus sp. LEh25]
MNQTDPLGNLQGQGGHGRAQGRQDAGAQQYDVHPSQITEWKQQLAEHAADVKALHAKIGQLTLENDFLEHALGKAGLLSGKR